MEDNDNDTDRDTFGGKYLHARFPNTGMLRSKLNRDAFFQGFFLTT